MKTLYLIRHAKASWDHTELEDFDRPLTNSGQVDAREMGQQLKNLVIKPDAIIASPAPRALLTAQLIAGELNFPLEKIHTDKNIYSSGVEELIHIIEQTNVSVNTLLLFGHNPNLTWLVHYLCEDAKMNMPTCGVVGIEFNMQDWAQLSNAAGKLITFIHPEHEQHS